MLARIALVGFASAACAILFAPILVGADYDWVSRSVSESAAQQTPGSWLARLGLTLSGLAVLLVCIARARHWGVLATVAMTLFGLSWLLTAVYSTESWRPDTPRDPSESALHSVFATAMAVVNVGAVILLVRRRVKTRVWQVATAGLVVAATLLPLAALLLPSVGGLFQRLMFAYAYAWFAREAIWAIRPPHRRRISPTG